MSTPVGPPTGVDCFMYAVAAWDEIILLNSIVLLSLP